MSDTSYPAVDPGEIQARLTAIEDRQAIKDAIYRNARSIDRLDLATFRSSFWPDGRYTDGQQTGQAIDFAEPLLARLREKYATTQHVIANILIDLMGDTASVESYAVAYHRTLPTPESNLAVLGQAWIESHQIDFSASHDLVVGLRYIDRLTKRGGEWRIAERRLVFDWSQAAPNSSLTSGGLYANTLLRGQRDRGDPVYASSPRPAT